MELTGTLSKYGGKGRGRDGTEAPLELGFCQVEKGTLVTLWGGAEEFRSQINTTHGGGQRHRCIQKKENWNS